MKLLLAGIYFFLIWFYSNRFLTIQGISEVFRAIICIKTGQWPARMASAEETEKILMRKSHKGEDTDVI